MIPGVALVATIVWLLFLVLLAAVLIWPDSIEDEPSWHAEADEELRREEGREP